MPAGDRPKNEPSPLAAGSRRLVLEIKVVYRPRKQVARLFRRIKRLRRIFTRYDRLDVLFRAFVTMALIWVFLNSVNRR